jgi:hypothetical protein
MKKIILIFIVGLYAFIGNSQTSCEIEEIYQATDLRSIDSDAVVFSNGDLIDNYDTQILSPKTLEVGKYVLNVTRKNANLYKIDGSDLYIKTKYCYEYGYSVEVVLDWESNYGYTKGNLIFD